MQIYARARHTPTSPVHVLVTSQLLRARMLSQMASPALQAAAIEAPVAACEKLYHCFELSHFHEIPSCIHGVPITRVVLQLGNLGMICMLASIKNESGLLLIPVEMTTCVTRARRIRRRSSRRVVSAKERRPSRSPTVGFIGHDKARHSAGHPHRTDASASRFVWR